MMQHMMGQSRMMQNCLGIQQIPRPSAAQVRARRSAASHNSRPVKCGWFNGVQMTELLIVSVLITLSICTQTSLAEARPGHKKPPFNGSIFGKRSMSSSSPSLSSMSSAAPGPLQAALLANNGGQWPLVGSDTSGLELVAAIQQQDSLIRSTINRCLTRQYDFAGELWRLSSVREARPRAGH